MAIHRGSAISQQDKKDRKDTQWSVVRWIYAMRNFVVVVVVFCLQIRSNKMSETKRKQRNKVICKFNNLISGFRYEYNFLLRLRLAQECGDSGHDDDWAVAMANKYILHVIRCTVAQPDKLPENYAFWNDAHQIGVESARHQRNDD